MRKMNMVMMAFVMMMMVMSSYGEKSIRSASLKPTGNLFGEDFESKGVLIGEIDDFRVDSDRNYWVLDAKESTIKVFDKSQVFLRSIGRNGRGPGEFGRIVPFFEIVGDTVAVLSLLPTKISLFDRLGNFKRDISDDKLPYSIRYCDFMSSGEYLLSVNSPGKDYLACLVDRSGVIVRKYAQVQSGGIIHMQEVQDQLSRGIIPEEIKRRVIAVAPSPDRVYLIYQYPPRIERYDGAEKMIKSCPLSSENEIESEIDNVKAENLELKQKGMFAEYRSFNLFKSVIVEQDRIYIQHFNQSLIDVVDLDLNPIMGITIPDQCGRLVQIEAGHFYFIDGSGMGIVVGRIDSTD